MQEASLRPPDAVDPNDPKPDAHTPTDGPRPDPRTLRSEDLLAGKREVLILHGELTYRLVLTRNGKLILQK